MDLIIYIYATRRSYFRPKRFWGVGGNASVGYDKQRERFSTSVIDNETVYTTIRPKIQYGVGRIEPVTSAWKAIRILKDFETFGVLSHTPSKAEINRLAQTIADNDYTRVYDSRLATIRRIQAIDQQIQSEKLINATGSTYYTLLYDSYLNGTQSIRYAGHRLTFELQPSFQVSLLDNTSVIHLLSAISYESYNPINQSWQLDYSLKCRPAIYNLNYQSLLGLGLQASFAATYYPNSRTDFKVKLTYGQNLLDELRSILSLRPFALDASANYYLSPRTRIFAYFTVNQSINMISFLGFPPNEYWVDHFGYGFVLRHAIF